MARKFLYLFAFLIVVAIAVTMALRFYGDGLSEVAFVPTAEFEKQEPLEANIYADPALWLQRPGAPGQALVRWLPDGFDGEDADALTAAVFFIHPTSYLDRARWNAALDDPESQDRAKLFVKAMASAFARGGDVWAPRYRQATFGAFLTDKPERDQALGVAYGDVLLAFDQFVKEAGPDRPIILAGHSQGALHLLSLLKDRVAGQPVAARIVAAYVIGWPVSIEADLPATGLPACETPEATGCVLSWQSYAEPADVSRVQAAFDSSTGLTGTPRKGTSILCTNPITGTPGGNAEATDNLGTLKPDESLSKAEMVKQLVPARCADDGFLLIGQPPTLGPYVLPGNNYHVYDIPLFWRNVRRDVEVRVRAMGDGGDH